MTAIIRTLTLEGTVLAAEGRNTGAVDGTVLSDSVQKIFPVATANGTVPIVSAALSTSSRMTGHEWSLISLTKSGNRQTRYQNGELAI
jgi:hypothetical protein